MPATDLHTHSWYSDGSLSPAALLARAADRGIQHLAITDHDSIGAWRSLTPTDIPAGLQLVTGVEISTLWESCEIHVLGLLVDCNNNALNTLVENQQKLRKERAAAIGTRLEKNGVTGLAGYLDALPCEAISRNHIADFLIKRGIASSTQQAFKRLLGNKGRYSVAATWCSIADAARTIKEADGIAVLAHPDRYRLTGVKMLRLIDEFREAGGEGLEVSYSNLNPDKLVQLGELCRRHQLWASTGSDFHTPEREWMDIGRIRQLPVSCREMAVWHHPRWLASGLSAV